jgi:uncharacterized protein with FMN-binding domain
VNKKIIISVIIISIAIVLIVFILLFMKDFNKFKKDLIAMQVNDINLKAVKDGEYEGYLDKKFITARLKVKVQNNKIISIDILEHKHGPNKKYGAEAITDRIIEKQSLDVDAVSGATGSSKVIRKAVELALTEGISK